jgi:hypothetical protein
LAGVAGLSEIPASLPSALIAWTVRWACGARLRERFDPEIDRRAHQVNVERLGAMPAQRRHHAGADRQVRDEMPVHYIDMDPVRARFVDGAHFLAEPGKVGREDRGRDQRFIHRALREALTPADSAGNHAWRCFPRRPSRPAAKGARRGATARLARTPGSADEGAVMDRSPRPLSPEFALLAACTLLDDARLAEVAAPLAQRPGFDWDRFVALGVFHGVEQVARLQLEHTLPGVMPAARKAELQRDFVHSAALYAAHTRMALTAVTALERARIPVLVLKGAALAGQLYAPTPEVRASSDVDILVPPEQLEAADAALRQAGLHRSWPEANPPEAARAMFLRFANVFDYQGPISGETVELHCRASRGD